MSGRLSPWDRVGCRQRQPAPGRQRSPWQRGVIHAIAVGGSNTTTPTPILPDTTDGHAEYVGKPSHVDESRGHDAGLEQIRVLGRQRWRHHGIPGPSRCGGRQAMGHEDEDRGPNITGPVADVANDIWQKGRNPKTMKTLFEKYPRPANVDCVKVDLNEVTSAVNKFAWARDLRLRAVQGLIARAAVPTVCIIDVLYDKENKISPQEQVNMAIDCCSLITNANSGINPLTRELLKPALQRRYQSLCNKSPQGENKLLFRENLAERVKATNTTSSLMAGPSSGPGMFGQCGYQPYGQPYYGGYGYQGYGGYLNFPQQRRGWTFFRWVNTESAL